MADALIQILDYGSGNLFSIRDALSRLSSNIRVKISSSYQEGKVHGLVLPGVGSFTSAQGVLSTHREMMLEDVRTKKMPLLGICLGMQLMFEKSEEGPGDGLGLFKGQVVRFKPEQGLKVPHMGWNTVSLSKAKGLNSAFCKGLKGEEWAYFVHSYYPVPEQVGIVSAWTRYGDQRFPSIIEKWNVFGTQFHPEKSSRAGFKLISNFARAVVSYSAAKKWN